MKAKLTITGLLAIASITVTLLALSAEGIKPAAAEGEAEQIDLDASYDGKEIEVAVGELIVVTFESNPATGFIWQLSEPLDEGLLALIDSRYEPGANAGQDMVGAGGSEIWTFKALVTGKTTISLEYSRPWEGGEKAVQTFEITVTIE